jgi:hypothetical protein
MPVHPDLVEGPSGAWTSAGARVSLLCALALLACTSAKDSDQAANDRTVQKLAEEMKKHPPMNMVPRAPGDELAKLASTTSADAQVIPLHGNPHEKVGTVEVAIDGATVRHSLSNGKISVASVTPFVQLELGVSNPGDVPASIDLGLAKLARDGDEEPVAIDAQRLAGTRKLDETVPPHGSITATLLFESPAPGKGTLNLVLPGSPEVRIPVQ